MEQLTTLQAALEAWVETLTGLTLHWLTGPPKALPFPHVEGQVLSIVGKGHDEEVWTYDADLDQNDLSMRGLRTLVVQLNFRSRSQALASSARFYAEQFRTRTRRPSSQDTLSAANLNLVETRVLADTDYEDRSGRLVSQVSMDLFFELRATEADATWGGQYIKKVTITSTEYVIDEDGTPIVDLDDTLVIVDV